MEVAVVDPVVALELCSLDVDGLEHAHPSQHAVDLLEVVDHEKLLPRLKEKQISNPHLKFKKVKMLDQIFLEKKEKFWLEFFLQWFNHKACIHYEYQFNDHLPFYVAKISSSKHSTNLLLH